VCLIVLCLIVQNFVGLNFCKTFKTGFLCLNIQKSSKPQAHSQGVQTNPLFSWPLQYKKLFQYIIQLYIYNKSSWHTPTIILLVQYELEQNNCPQNFGTAEQKR